MPIRRFHQGVSESDAGTGTEGYRSVSVPPFWSVAGQSGTTPHNAGDQKNGEVEIRQQHCRYEKSGRLQIPSDLNKSQLTYFEATRLSSRGAYPWETPSRGRFTTMSGGGRLFLNLVSNDRVGRAA